MVEFVKRYVDLACCLILFAAIILLIATVAGDRPDRFEDEEPKAESHGLRFDPGSEMVVPY